MAGGWCASGLPFECVSERLTATTWGRQCNVNIVVPAIPDWLSSFNKSNPAASLRVGISEADGMLALLPGRIAAQAGRRKLHKRTRKTTNTHFARYKSASEKGDGRRNSKKTKMDSDVNGEDEEIVFDEEVAEIERVSDSSSDSSDHDGEDAEERPAGVGLVMSAPVTSIADLWRVGSEVVRTQKADAACRSCGATGHKWPKCRARNIELMLSKMSVLPSREGVIALSVVHVPQVASNKVAVARKLLPERRDDTILAVTIGAKPAAVLQKPVACLVPQRGERKRGTMTDTCVYCDEETAHETWRHYGTKCVECKFSFAHFACVKGGMWTCEVCEPAQGAGE